VKEGVEVDCEDEVDWADDVVVEVVEAEVVMVV
jgi:hypothetical protein